MKFYDVHLNQTRADSLDMPWLRTNESDITIYELKEVVSIEPKTDFYLVWKKIPDNAVMVESETTADTVEMTLEQHSWAKRLRYLYEMDNSPMSALIDLGELFYVDYIVMENYYIATRNNA